VVQTVRAQETGGDAVSTAIELARAALDDAFSEGVKSLVSAERASLASGDTVGAATQRLEVGLRELVAARSSASVVVERVVKSGDAR
jgi:hypothetical protein